MIKIMPTTDFVWSLGSNRHYDSNYCQTRVAIDTKLSSLIARNDLFAELMSSLMSWIAVIQHAVASERPAAAAGTV